MRIALIGVGRIGVLHASTLRGRPGADSPIITDADTGRARQGVTHLHGLAGDQR